MAFQRASGILLHPTCLPSRFGIGDLGQAAYAFVDFLERSGQTLWQVLPLGPTGLEHSPYIMNFSSFAGNPLLIDLDQLAAEGLLAGETLAALPEEGDSAYGQVNFAAVLPHKFTYLKQAFTRFQPDDAFKAFCQEQDWWLEDYVLFMALYDASGHLPWNQWEPALVRRDPAALQTARATLAEPIQFYRFLQFKFFEQWAKLRAYANEKGIQIVGDISIYVCHNSADVWSAPDMFKLDPETFDPAFMAGVPPDYFSATGQLWGNPVYDWDKMEQANFAWWVNRFKATLLYVDIVRIDHFRGFEAYWQVPGSETTAMNGEWVKGPDAKFFEVLKAAIGSLPVMAEDLGIITPEVELLRDRFNFPGMRILQFAFGGDPANPYLPHHYVPNAVVYPGTHDNDTAIGWWNTTGESEKQHVTAYFGHHHSDHLESINWLLIRAALASVADLAILPLQDVLGLDGRARMNDPRYNDGQWRWRFTDVNLLSPDLAERLGQLTRMYSR